MFSPPTALHVPQSWFRAMPFVQGTIIDNEVPYEEVCHLAMKATRTFCRKVHVPSACLAPCLEALQAAASAMEHLSKTEYAYPIPEFTLLQITNVLWIWQYMHLQSWPLEKSTQRQSKRLVKATWKHLQAYVLELLQHPSRHSLYGSFFTFHLELELDITRSAAAIKPSHHKSFSPHQGQFSDLCFSSLKAMWRNVEFHTSPNLRAAIHQFQDNIKVINRNNRDAIRNHGSLGLAAEELQDTLPHFGPVLQSLDRAFQRNELQGLHTILTVFNLLVCLRDILVVYGLAPLRYTRTLTRLFSMTDAFVKDATIGDFLQFTAFPELWNAVQPDLPRSHVPIPVSRHPKPTTH